ncbi:hypothetical protein Sru01_37840 [Sphaerisporangium rufum]|uniref:FHA domain-containing protein n=1 Tax=Sphaerisporangium rufum TaxID=1381558 RepID=A0A919R7T7_9ACTN|nr:FHA domain-containing protein [Sphaerisporangium rufum]GII78802.1 hypothetical protein Sru01_37840 [Sphaerisporangium rufum]
MMATCPQGHESADEEYCDICGALMSGAAAPAPGGSGQAGAPAGSGPAPAEAGPDGPCPDCGAPRTGRFCETCGYDFVLGGGRPSPPQERPAAPAAPAAPGGTTGSWRPAEPWRPAAPVPPAAPIAAETPAVPLPTPYPAAPPVAPDGAPSAAPSGQPAAPAAGWTAVIEADRAHYDEMVGQGGPDAAAVAFPPYCPPRSVPLTGAQVRIGRHSRSRSLRPEIDLSGPPEDPGVSHLHAVLLAGPDGGWSLVDPGSANGTLVDGEPAEVNVPVPLADGARVHLGAWTLITVRKAAS